MNRKRFIESVGATCKNWTWSWSFINQKERLVIFGAWDIHTNGQRVLILDESWGVGKHGNKKPAFTQSLEHIRMVEEGGYRLKTFPIVYSKANKNPNRISPSRIKSFTPVLTLRQLQHVGGKWFAVEEGLPFSSPEEIERPEEYYEGSKHTVLVNAYERDPNARAECVKHYGYKCRVCSFNFESVYGPLGEKYIHVHHVVPLSQIGKEYKVDPIHDLVPLCPNCHAMIHRTPIPLTVKELRNRIKSSAKKAKRK